jgi:YebC/PmpR family DNA-binding regulatory protein
MSGHSKWSKIKHKKALEDAKRGKIFSKLSRLITLTAREKGGNPETNSELKLAVERAKSFNMPQDNIERAIKKGAGGTEGGKLENFLMEAFGPGNVSILIQIVTDNKNRSLAEIRKLIENYGGKVANGGVAWKFEKKGVISIPFEGNEERSEEDLELDLIEAGVEDFKDKKELLEAFTKVEDLYKVKIAIEEKGVKIESSALEWVAKEEIKIESEDIKKKIENLFEALDENDDVQEIYSDIK